MTDKHEEIANNLLDEIENAEPFESDEVESDKDQNQSCGLVTMKEAILEFYRELDKPPVQQIKTGFSSLDGLVDGFRPGQMIVMAARPGLGKTALATNIITNMLDDGIPALLFSLEMSRLEIIQRLFSSVGKIPLREIRAQDRTQHTLDAIAETGNILSGWPLVMNDNPRLRVADIETLSRDGINSHGIGCIIIVAKNRNGTTGHINLFWEGEYTRFVDLPKFMLQGPEDCRDEEESETGGADEGGDYVGY